MSTTTTPEIRPDMSMAEIQKIRADKYLFATPSDK